MRKIKFRGKQKENGEWIVGYYGYKDLSDEHFIIVPTFDSHSTNRPQYFTDHLVECDTISEFTGMKDRNGKDIYESDIVSIDCGTYKEKSIITFRHGAFRLTNNDMLPDGEDLEVIGNIYD